MEAKEKGEGFIGQRMVALPLSTIDLIENNAIIKDFYVSQLGYYPNAKNHHRIRHSGAFEHIFIYCVDGEGTVKIEKKVHSISKNQFIIIPKGVQHEYYADVKKPWSIYWMHLNGDKVDALREKFFATFNLNVASDNKKIKEFNVIYDMLAHEPSINMIELANIYSLRFISQFVYKSINIESQSKVEASIITEVITFIQQHIDQDLCISKIAKVFKLEENYLQTQFKKHTGYPIVRYVNNRRIQKACEYLNYTNLTIKEIAYHCGFNDPLYFSRFFKKSMGKSPRRYRKDLGIKDDKPSTKSS